MTETQMTEVPQELQERNPLQLWLDGPAHMSAEVILSCMNATGQEQVCTHTAGSLCKLRSEGRVVSPQSLFSKCSSGFAAATLSAEVPTSMLMMSGKVLHSLQELLHGFHLLHEHQAQHRDDKLLRLEKNIPTQEHLPGALCPVVGSVSGSGCWRASVSEDEVSESSSPFNLRRITKGEHLSPEGFPPLG